MEFGSLRYVFLDTETTGLSPLVHRIVCIGHVVGDKEHVFMDRDEKKVLTIFLDLISVDDVLVGYNLRFDVGFLTLRCIKHKIDPKKLLGCTQIDLMEKVKMYIGGRYAPPLEKVALFLELNQEETVGGESVPELWDAGEYEPIKRHCLSDVRLAKQIFERLKQLLFEPATQSQKDYMRSLGIAFDENTTKAEASRLIDKATRKG